MRKHKLIAFAAALMLLSAILAPAACADWLVIPDIPAVYENIKLLEADGNMRMYYAEDGDQALEGVKFYAYTLFELYDFDSLAYDTESSDSIIYLYIKYYYGDADIESEYMDDCPEPCYVLFGLTGYDEGALIASCVADGITIGDISAESVQTETTAYTPPVAGNNGLLVMPMEEYFDGIELGYMFVEDNYYGCRYANQGRYYDGDGSDEYRAMYEQYVNDLVSTGYYVLLAHEDDNLSERWRLGYAGDSELETFRIWKSDNADAVIVVDLLYEDGRVYYSEDIATTNLEEAAIASGFLE